MNQLLNLCERTTMDIMAQVVKLDGICAFQ